MVFGVRVFHDPFDRIIIGEDSRSSSNGVKSRIPDSLVEQLVILDIKKVVIVKNYVNPRSFNLVSISDSTTGFRENTKVWVLNYHVLLKAFAEGNSSHFEIETLCLNA